MTQDQKFEIPQELRQLAEENVERARQLYLHAATPSGRSERPKPRRSPMQSAFSTR